MGHSLGHCLIIGQWTHGATDSRDGWAHGKNLLVHIKQKTSCKVFRTPTIWTNIGHYDTWDLLETPAPCQAEGSLAVSDPSEPPPKWSCQGLGYPLSPNTPGQLDNLGFGCFLSI